METILVAGHDLNAHEVVRPIGDRVDALDASIAAQRCVKDEAMTDGLGAARGVVAGVMWGAILWAAFVELIVAIW